VIVSSAVYGHSGGNIPSVMLGSPRDATSNMIMIGTGRERWPTVRVADLADVFRRVPGRRPRRPTVSDQSMWRAYTSNVTSTSLAGLRVLGYARLSSSTGMVRTPAVWRAYSAKPG
jgi:hypothetical protein